jgi:putative chitinase
MDVNIVTHQLILAGLLGMIGQGIRAVVGFKKMADKAKENGDKVSAKFSTKRLFMSLGLGFLAGILAVFTMSDFDNNAYFIKTKESMLTLMGIGYAGADFVEGFAGKFFAGLGGGSISSALGASDEEAVG